MNKKHFLIISLLTAMLSLTSVSVYADPIDIPLQVGYVTLGQGDITLKADYVVIKNSTTVPLGTTLKIEN